MKQSILHECLRVAREKHCPSHPSWDKKAVHYSFIVQNNKILGMGVNRPSLHPPKHYGYPFYSDLHAEIDAWRKVRGILEEKKWEIVNVKISKRPNFPIADAAPCPVCFHLCVKLGCKAFYFSTNSGQMAKLIS